jgi:hypothetical protein
LSRQRRGGSHGHPCESCGLACASRTHVRQSFP